VVTLAPASVVSQERHKVPKVIRHSKPMSKGRHLDPRAQVAISHLQECPDLFYGAICPRNLPAVLPKCGDRRSWKDATAVFLLSELISVHRVLKGKTPYWSGALYQINRNDLARQFACDPDDVSAALHWLKALGVVDVVHHTRIDGTGKPCGTEVFAFPFMDRIHLMLDFFAKNKCPIPASELFDSNPLEAGMNSPSRGSELTAKQGSSRPEHGEYLNCAQPQQKLADEIGGEASAKRRSPVVNDDRGSLAVDGGGVADADNGTQTPPPAPRDRKASPVRPTAPMPPATAQGANNSPRTQTQPKGVANTGHVSNAPTARWTAPKLPNDIESNSVSIEAWLKACLFCQLWALAVVRRGHVHICNPTPVDQRTAYDFFHANPQTGSFRSIAVAIAAWTVGTEAPRAEKKWDRYYFCRQTLEINAFLRAYKSGKLQPEIGHAGWDINTYEDLRTAFVESELKFFGFTRIPVMEMDPEDLWENHPDTPEFYRVRNLPLPPEVAASAKAEHDTGT